MEKTLSRFSQKTQISFLKLKIMVKEQDKIPSYIISDMQILRFLIYHEKQIDLAHQKILEHIKWRKNNKELFDQARKTDLCIETEAKKQGFQMGNYGVTKSGRPLRITIMSDGDYMEVQQKYKDIFLAYNIAYMERLMNIVFPSIKDQYGQEPDGTISIVDVQNLRVTDFIKNIGAQKEFKKISNLITQNYPYTNKRTYIINAGTFFTAFWNLLKNLLSEKITKKVVILNDDFLPELLKEVNIDNLPEILGGKCKYKIGEYPNPWREEYQKSIQEQTLGEEFRKKIENKDNQIQKYYQCVLSNYYLCYFFLTNQILKKLISIILCLVKKRQVFLCGQSCIFIQLIFQKILLSYNKLKSSNQLDYQENIFLVMSVPNILTK